MIWSIQQSLYFIVFDSYLMGILVQYAALYFQISFWNDVWFGPWEDQNFSVLNLSAIVILWVYYTIPFGLFCHVWDIS